METEQKERPFIQLAELIEVYAEFHGLTHVQAWSKIKEDIKILRPPVNFQYAPHRSQTG